MAAGLVAAKKLTLAVPIASVKRNLVGTVVTVKIGLERGDTDPVLLLGIFPGFVNLPNEARVHHHLQEIYRRPDDVILESGALKVKHMAPS
jgi:hypothetical protein